MHSITIRLCLAFALLAAVAGVPGANVQAQGQAFLDQDWVLNSGVSNISLQTEKLEGVVEKHKFTMIEGSVSQNGDARITIDLSSLETGIDLRNVRMRFLLFETFKFPTAEITARLDKNRLRELGTSRRISYPLKARVNLHGIVQEIDIPVSIERVNDTTVTVSTIRPVVVSAQTFDFTRGIGKLSEAQGGIRIVPEAAITFDLTFGTGAQRQQLEAARVQREQVRTQQATQTISTEGCETRLTVITEANAIYFKTGSAEIDRESEPMLDNGADIATRCPGVRFEVEGHTDNVGGHRFNQRLSELRAKSVVDYLTGKGVAMTRIHSVGYGETRPVASNISETGRSKNRRIEFKVKRD